MALLPTDLPILPSLKPGQSYTTPTALIRGAPGWNFKETAKWSNFRQQSANGKVLVVKYWSNPLWTWEWNYGVVKDRPNEANPFFTLPIPATDFEILKAFYAGLQGSGGEFAYQPPDSVRGGSFTVTSVSATTANLAVLGINGVIPATQSRLGDTVACSGFSTATYLNSQIGKVVGFDSNKNQITVAIPTTGTHASVTDSGTALIGQPLGSPDSNNLIELSHTIGSYPLTPVVVPTMQLVVESVQLLLQSSLTIYDNTGTSLNGHYSLNSPGAISSYAGFVANFGAFTVSNPPLFAAYTYYFPCRFSEDTQEYENFSALLWMCSSFKFDQVRI